MDFKFHIASPCSSPWERMHGDERVRHCPECNHKVYNFAEMTQAEVEELIGKGGRVCARLYQRADGTALTKDCPVGFKVRVRRVSRAAGIALAASAMLNPGRAIAQSQGVAQPQMTYTAADHQTGLLVELLDKTGAIVENAKVVLKGKSKHKEVALTGHDGRASFSGLDSGEYKLTLDLQGFKVVKRKIKIESGKVTILQFALEPLSHDVVVGMI